MCPSVDDKVGGQTYTQSRVFGDDTSATTSHSSGLGREGSWQVALSGARAAHLWSLKPQLAQADKHAADMPPPSSLPPILCREKEPGSGVLGARGSRGEPSFRCVPVLPGHLLSTCCMPGTAQTAEGRGHSPSGADAEMSLELCDLQGDPQAAAAFETLSTGVSKEDAQSKAGPASGSRGHNASGPGRPHTGVCRHRKKRHTSPFSGHWAFMAARRGRLRGAARPDGRKRTWPLAPEVTASCGETELIQTGSGPLGPHLWFPVQGSSPQGTAHIVGCHNW